MSNPSIIVKSITEKLEFLTSLEILFHKAREMLYYLGIKPPDKLDFNYYWGLIKQREQDLAFARWKVQRQYREWFLSNMNRTGLIKKYKNKEKIEKVYKKTITEEGVFRYQENEGPPRKKFTGIYIQNRKVQQ